MLVINDAVVYDRHTAMDVLIRLVGSRIEADEFVRLLGVDDCLDQKLESAVESADEYERLCDSYHSAVCEAVNIIDDALEKQRLSNARKILAQVRNALEW